MLLVIIVALKYQVFGKKVEQSRHGTGGLTMAKYIEKAAALSIHESPKSNRYYQTDNLDAWQSRKPDDFCSYGERKEGAD